MTDISIYDVFEGMTSISAVIKSIREGSANRSINKVLYDSERISKKTRELGFLKHAADELGFEMVSSNNETISSMTSGNTHGGIIAVCTKRHFPELNVNYLTSIEVKSSRVSPVTSMILEQSTSRLNLRSYL